MSDTFPPPATSPNVTDSDKVKGIVDIVFLIDATGSMAPCIDALKKNINSFIDTLSTKNANNECPVKHWRARVVGYRDYVYDPGHGLQALINNPFVDSTESLRAQLANLKAEGGGDEPESLLDALYDVINIGSSGAGAQEADPNKWRHKRAAARCVVVFTDAPFHTTMSGPGREAGGVTDVINLCHTERIILALYAPEGVGCEDLARANKAILRAIPCPSDTENARQKALAEYTSNSDSFQKVMIALAKTISKSSDVPLL